jgi:tetratricopeptide (TPR) repeat protein
LLIEAQLLKASFAEEDNDLGEAEQAYRRALFIDRKCAIAHFHLALVLQQKGNLPAAKRSLKIAAELVRDENVHQAVPHGEGLCYGRLQEMIEGIADS